MNQRKKLRRKIERKQKRLTRLLEKSLALRKQIEHEAIDLEAIGVELINYEREHPYTGENETRLHPNTPEEGIRDRDDD